MLLSDTVEKFKKLTKHPERYLQAQNAIAEEIKHLLKDVYDFTKKQESSEKNRSALPELIIKNFDDEQIWQELELQNSLKYHKFILDIPRIIVSKNRLCYPLNVENTGVSDSENESGDIEDERDSIDKETLFEDVSNGSKLQGREKRKIRPSVVDDRFFKLSELEEYLDKEDNTENEKHKKSKYKIDRDNVESDESIDLFEDVISDDNEMEEGGIHYNAFFDAPEDCEQNTTKRKRNLSEMDDTDKTDDPGGRGEGGGEEEEEEEEEEGNLNLNNDKLSDVASGKKNDKQVRFDLLPASSTDSSDTENDNFKKDDDKKFKSNFDARQERLQARIKALEDKALLEKPWQLQGEVSASNRPQNSLLEEVLEFDMTSRPAPMVTEQTTMKLEDIIRQRIKDKSWDDVERKVKPTMAPDEYKKQLVMDHEKSKFSLAEIYEQEYLKQKEAQDPEATEKPEEEPQEHQTIRAMTSSLFAKLDALTNFHYTPKLVIPEIKIVSNLPAITMEEVAPVATSDATLLAPEEVKAKEKGDLIGKTERTKTDKKRERRQKKIQQRMKQKEKEKREKIVEKLRPGLGNKYSKEKALDTLKKLSNDRNVHQLKDEGKDKGVRSSTAFFSRLQDEMSGSIKGKLQEPKEKEKFSAKKVKL